MSMNRAPSVALSHPRGHQRSWLALALWVLLGSCGSADAPNPNPGPRVPATAAPGRPVEATASPAPAPKPAGDQGAARVRAGDASTPGRGVGEPVAVEILSLAQQTSRTDWCTVAVPAALVPKDARSGWFGASRWPAVVGRRLGEHSVLVHIACREVGPGQRVGGDLEFSASEPAAFEDDPWAAADDLVPWPIVQLRNSASGVVATRQLRGRAQEARVRRRVVHEDAAERITRFELRFADRDQASPLFWRAWLYQYSGSPVARWDVQLVHSDSSSAAMYASIQGFGIETVKPHLVDHGWALGAGKLAAPVANGPSTWRTELLEAVALADGVRPTWTGVSMSSPRPGQAVHPRQGLRLSAARAATEGPLLGCVAQGVWDGHWLALERTPAVPGIDPWAAGVAAHGAWVEHAKRRGTYWAPRFQSMDKFPGRTGAQPNHGIVRGGEIVSTGCPQALDGYAARLTAHLRPTAYYEPSMQLVTGQEHPRWRTWQGRSFVRDEFRDSLSKAVGESGQVDRPDTEGWLAPDEQHYGHLELCAYYALTGRLFAKQLMMELTEVWLVAFHELEGRGIGRSWLDMASIYRLTGDARILAHIQEIHDGDMGGWFNRIRGSVKVWPRFNDPRALRNARGDSVDCAVAWQIGLMAPGLEAARRVTGSQAIARTLSLNVEGLVQCGWFRSPGGQWMEVDYWWFRDGQPTLAEDYGQDGNVAGRTHRTGWFGDWVAYATLLGQRVLDGDLREKARAIAVARYSDRPRDWVSAQWRLPVE